jgi:hypothetical protein
MILSKDELSELKSLRSYNGLTMRERIRKEYLESKINIDVSEILELNDWLKWQLQECE